MHFYLFLIYDITATRKTAPISYIFSPLFSFFNGCVSTRRYLCDIWAILRFILHCPWRRIYLSWTKEKAKLKVLPCEIWLFACRVFWGRSPLLLFFSIFFSFFDEQYVYNHMLVDMEKEGHFYVCRRAESKRDLKSEKFFFSFFFFCSSLSGTDNSYLLFLSIVYQQGDIH